MIVDTTVRVRTYQTPAHTGRVVERETFRTLMEAQMFAAEVIADHRVVRPNYAIPSQPRPPWSTLLDKYLVSYRRSDDDRHWTYVLEDFLDVERGATCFKVDFILGRRSVLAIES